ncbi:F-box family protein [Rhynchospora pubera]|uniref:F-box family protein n=1 Tax=Rhynchospora pubera TaxID=906938 RepID=A0AAV8DRI1_9POAL|nr:F-box family protein [Rhynchospora pubera]
MNTIERDWAVLPPDLLRTIARKLIDIFDFVRFRSVCKTWHSLITIADLFPQFPWILNRSRGPDLHFYSIAFDKSFTINAPKFSNKTFFFPCQGLMLVRSRTTFWSSLINPLNNCEVWLPVFLDLIHDQWIGSRSFQSGDYVVFKGFGRKLHVFKPGDCGDKWINMEGEDCSIYFYLNKLLFIVHSLSWFTKVINLRTRKTVFVVPPPWNVSTMPTSNVRSIWHRPTLIESSGEILHVTYAYEFKKFVIHRLEVGNGKENPCWVIVTNIGDRMLFIDFHHNNGDFSLKATDFCGFNFKGNCIYFIREDKLRKNDGYYSDPIYVVERYDIESATTELIHIQEGYITCFA